MSQDIETQTGVDGLSKLNANSEVDEIGPSSKSEYVASILSESQKYQYKNGQDSLPIEDTIDDRMDRAKTVELIQPCEETQSGELDLELPKIYLGNITGKNNLTRYGN